MRLLVTFNIVILPMVGKTESCLTLSEISATRTGTYELAASNARGAAVSSAILTVRPKPDLRFTEVLPSPAANATLDIVDRWELVSFKDQPVNLPGWRLD